MKYLLVFLMLVVSPAWAGWTLVATSSETPSDKYFLDFVVEKINNKRSEWKKEYGDDFEVHINKHSNNYTQSLIFELKN